MGRDLHTRIDRRSDEHLAGFCTRRKRGEGIDAIRTGRDWRQTRGPRAQHGEADLCA